MSADRSTVEHALPLAEAVVAAGAFGGSGTSVTRPAWTRELLDVYAWFGERLAEMGLDVEVDAAGNLLGRWEAGEGPALLVGSHMDTVPNGGRYDGTLGVLSAYRALALLRERGFQPKRPIWLVSFMDEEGARFKTAMFGSRAFLGDDLSDVAERTDADGVTLRDAMTQAGFSFDRVGEARAIDRVGGYLELHIEQGPVLERTGKQIGVVTGIAGLRGLNVRYEGWAAHSGTTPMDMRRDAMAGAARAVLAVRDLAREREGVVATVGIMRAEPGGFNVVPGGAEFSVDVRSAEPDKLDAAEADVRALLERIAEEEDLVATLTPTYRLEPLVLDAGYVEAVERAAEEEGASHVRMPSGAGHDAMLVGAHVPAAMLFVPSRDGVSHNPAEYTSDEDCERGARVLARAIERLAG